MTNSKILFILLILLNLAKDYISPFAHFTIPLILKNNANIILSFIIILIMVFQVIEYVNNEEKSISSSINTKNNTKSKKSLVIILLFHKIIIAMIFSMILTSIWLIVLNLFIIQSSGIKEILFPFLSFFLISILLYRK